MANDSVIKKVVREVVKEELKAGFDSLLGAVDRKNTAILRAIDKRDTNLLEAIDKKNYDLRSDVAEMKDEIMGELKTIREEQTMLNGRTTKINQIEDRVDRIENIHPQGQHASL